MQKMIVNWKIKFAKLKGEETVGRTKPNLGHKVRPMAFRHFKIVENYSAMFILIILVCLLFSKNYYTQLLCYTFIYKEIEIFHLHQALRVSFTANPKKKKKLNHILKLNKYSETFTLN